MPLEQELNQVLKEAMYAKDQRTADVVRMIKTRITERRTAPGFKGAVDDPLIQEVIASYQKQLRKALEEYQSTGERGAEMRAQLGFEIGFCDRFLPQKMGEAEVRALVREAILRTGMRDAKQAGRLVGEIMKTHKGQVEAALVKKLAEEELAKP
jgi:uncharacterized protein YqeY